MSYDLDVVIKKSIHSDNYTSNVYEMYEAAYSNVISNEEKYPNVSSYTRAFQKTWKEAITSERIYSLPALRSMVDELKSNPKFYKTFEPDNGWGNYEGAVGFLEKAYNAMLISEDAYIELDC